MERKGAELQEQEQKDAMAASSAVFSFLALPLSLLRHLADGCAGFLQGLSRPKPGAAPAEAHGGSEDATEEDCAVVVQVRSRGGPQRPQLREWTGGNGGAHH
ncbi:hypothetical protein ACP4OV_029340 [Aristida adscensionis]